MADIEARIAGAIALFSPDARPVYGPWGTVDRDYLEGIAEVKRFAECWWYDPAFRDAVGISPVDAFAERGLALSPADVEPIWRGDDTEADASAPRATRLFQAFRLERTLRVDHAAAESRQSATPLFARWQAEQRAAIEHVMGPEQLERVALHGIAFELQVGCSVGCWFCGVSAPELGAVWRYTPANAALWRAVLESASRRIGATAGSGFCYWASDPLDNPDYERFADDFGLVFGTYPQVTTAIPLRDRERTRRLLAQAWRSRREVHRFSVLTLRALRDLHRAFSPMELLHVELAPRYRASGKPLTAAGRARSRLDEGRHAEFGAPVTIACVAGFLVNMAAGTVRLVAPCRPDPKRPDGFAVLDERRFTDADGFDASLGAMLDEHMSAPEGRLRAASP